MYNYLIYDSFFMTAYYYYHNFVNEKDHVCQIATLLKIYIFFHHLSINNTSLTLKVDII